MCDACTACLEAFTLKQIEEKSLPVWNLSLHVSYLTTCLAATGSYCTTCSAVDLIVWLYLCTACYRVIVSLLYSFASVSVTSSGVATSVDVWDPTCAFWVPKVVYIASQTNCTVHDAYMPLSLWWEWSLCTVMGDCHCGYISTSSIFMTCTICSLAIRHIMYS